MPVRIGDRYRCRIREGDGEKDLVAGLSRFFEQVSFQVNGCRGTGGGCERNGVLAVCCGNAQGVQQGCQNLLPRYLVGQDNSPVAGNFQKSHQSGLTGVSTAEIDEVAGPAVFEIAVDGMR